MTEIVCRKCNTLINCATQYRFGSNNTGWEHMEGECVGEPQPGPYGMIQIVPPTERNE